MEPFHAALLAFVAVALLLSAYCFGFGTSCEPVSWQVAYGSSSCMSPTCLFYVRVALAVTFVSVLVCNLNESWRDGYWLIYMTQQAMTLETVFFVALAMFTRPAVLAAHYQDVPESESTEAPAEFRVLMVLSTLCLPLSLTVLLLFWTLVTPFWKLCAVAPAAGCKVFPTHTSFFMHFLNAGLILLHFLVSRIPFRLQNAGWYLAFPALYILWTLVHYSWRVGVHRTEHCFAYLDRHDCPIYDAVDWHSPGATFKLLVLVWVVLGVGLAGLCSFVGRARDSADPALASGGERVLMLKEIAAF